MSTLKNIILAAVLTCSAGIGHAATVDFETFAEGDVLGANTNLGGGVFANISAVSNQNEAVIFQTKAPSISTGNDPDLASPFVNTQDATDTRSFGNVLIAQENASNGPDDQGGGSTITFSFLDVVSLGELILLDSETATTAKLFSGSTLVKSFTLTLANESDTIDTVTPNEFTLLDFGNVRGNTLVVDFAGSGAVGEFNANVVPLPAGMPLLIGGIGAFAWLKRRKKA